MRWTLALVVLMRVATAHAGEEVWRHRFGAELHLAAGIVDVFNWKSGPFGNLGGAIDIAVLPWFSIAAGGGYSPGGGQWGVIPRLRYVEDQWGFNVGAGITGGHYESRETFESVTEKGAWDPAFSLAIETGFEHRWSSGVLLRVYAGVATVLNTDSVTCPDAALAPCDREGLTRFYMGIAIGGFAP